MKVFGNPAGAVLLAIALLATSVQAAAASPLALVAGGPAGAVLSPSPSVTEAPSITDEPTPSVTAAPVVTVQPTPGVKDPASPAPQPTTDESAASDPAVEPSTDAKGVPQGEPVPADTGRAALGVGGSAISVRWAGLGGATGPLGNPVSDVFCGLKNAGCAQRFERGAIHWSAATGAHPTRSAIAERWASLNWESGMLGYPLDAQYCGLRDNGCVQHFEGGAVHWSAASGANPTRAAIADRWAALNWEAGRLGYPLTAEICTLRDSGCVQRFQGGAVYWSAAGGAHAVWGSILGGYAGMNWEAGRLGYPTGPESCGLRDNGCLQRFENGAMHWSPASGAYGTTAGIAERWASLNWESGPLGYPVSREFCGLQNDGCVQRFQGGAVYWSPFGGAQPIWGAILGTYASRGWEHGSLGYPIGPERCGGACVQEFQFGRLTWSSTKGIDFHLRSDGYCAALNRGSIRYDASSASRVSFAIAEGYPDQGINFTTCVREGGSFRLEWVVPGFAGESGFARPGVASGPTINKFSPTGAFTVTEAFGLGDPGTSLYYRQLNPYSRWGGRLNGNYNKYFESSADVFPDENMWYYATRWSHDYRQGVVINYNRPPDSPIVPNAGFAIFLHANKVPTWGCISLDETDIVRYQRSAVPGDKIVMGVVDDVFW
ncbi:hypothetical protein [Arthrobacter sp. TB 26]|uniref:hypothetical protein n=1 Tax=Arthrobacter sp. TB 26 TaxID=494420 RepID=UPI00040F5695|nr:hypothetical protein [Arthrobacter sp. TB 26]